MELNSQDFIYADIGYTGNLPNWMLCDQLKSAPLECARAIFTKKLDDLDCVSFSRATL